MSKRNKQTDSEQAINTVMKDLGLQETIPDQEKTTKENENITGITKIDECKRQLEILVASGRSKEFINKNFTLNDIDAMSNKDLLKYYQIYMSALSARMNDTISSNFVYLYSKLCEFVLPIGDAEKLESDLRNDYIFMTNLNQWAGWLSLKMGPAMSLVTASLITIKNCKINDRESTGKESTRNRPCNISAKESKISETDRVE